MRLSSQGFRIHTVNQKRCGVTCSQLELATGSRHPELLRMRVFLAEQDKLERERGRKETTPCDFEWQLHWR